MNEVLKRELCEAIIDDYCREYGIKRTDLSVRDIYVSTTLGIAMHYLGFTDNWTKKDINYIQNREGNIKTYVSSQGKAFILDLRHILEG